MSTVLMRHPSLPPEQEIEVDEQAVPHYAQSGWVHVPTEELEVRAAAAARAAAEAVAAEKATAVADVATDQNQDDVGQEADATDESEPAPARRRATKKE